MVKQRTFLAGLILSCNGAGLAFAGVDLPVDTIKKMADINRVNGLCGFDKVEIQSAGGQRTLAMDLSFPGRSVSATLKLKEGESIWTESQGLNQARQPFWRFTLEKGDRSSPGAITAVDWDVDGSDLKTSSLTLSYIDPESLSEVRAKCL